MAYNLQKMVANYTAGVNPTNLKEDIVALKPTMVSAMQTVIHTQVSLEGMVKGVLAGLIGGSPISMAHTKDYIAFAKVLHTIKQRYTGGPICIRQAAIKLAWYQSLGLDTVALGAIRDQIFTIPQP